MSSQSLLSAKSLVVVLLTLKGANTFHMASYNQRAATSLDAVSRRQVFASSAVAASVPLVLLQEEVQAAATETPTLLPDTKTAAKYYFNGVFRDKKHPDGYRVVAGGVNKEGIITLQDSRNGEVTEIAMFPMKDEATGKLTIKMDLSKYRGDLQKEVVATVKKDGCLLFPDGNVWIKEKGVAGVYVDGFAPYPKFRRVVLPPREGNAVITMVSGKKIFEVPGLDLGKKGLQVEFPGGKQCTGTVNSKAGTISWSDGNIWTKI